MRLWSRVLAFAEIVAQSRWCGIGVAGLFGVYFAILYVVPPIRYYSKSNVLAFDYGIMFQSTYLVSQLKPLFMTIRGDYVWADNQDYFQCVLAWLHYLPNSQYWLLAFHSLGIFACGVFCTAVLWRYGRRVALAVGCAVWAHPILTNANTDLFHTETFATIFLLLLYEAARRGARVSFYVSFVAALCCKEDVALTLGLFAVLALMDRRSVFAIAKAHWVLVLVLSVVVFLLNFGVVLPYYKLKTCLWLDPQFAGPAMTSTPAAPWFQGALRNWYRPSYVLSPFLSWSVLLYVVRVAWPLLLVAAQPRMLFLLPLAGLFVNVVSRSGYLTDAYYHYDSCTMAGVLIGFMEGLRACRRRGLVAAVLLGLVLAGNFVGYKVRSPVHSALYPRFYDLRKDGDVVFLERLSRALPEETALSADYVSVNYLIGGHSAEYMFTNPFRRDYFGLYGFCEQYAVPPRVDIVVLRESMSQRSDLGELIPAGLRHVWPAGVSFDLWVAPSFLDGPGGAGLRVLLEELQREVREKEDRVARQGNLLMNGSFETVREEGAHYWHVEQWEAKGASAWEGVMRDRSVDGEWVAGIRHTGLCDSRWVQQVDLEKGGEYCLSGWIRTEGVPADGGGAYLQIEGTGIKTRVVQGGMDWTYVRAFGRVGREHRGLKVLCRLGDYGRPTGGVAYFDQVSLRRVPE